MKGINKKQLSERNFFAFLHMDREDEGRRFNPPYRPYFQDGLIIIIEQLKIIPKVFSDMVPSASADNLLPSLLRLLRRCFRGRGECV